MSAWGAEIAKLRAQMNGIVDQVIPRLVGWTLTAKSSAMGDRDQVETADGQKSNDTGQQRPVRRIEPWGHRGRAPGKVRSLWLRLGSSNVVFIGIAPSKGYGPNDLDDGETALYCAKDGTEVRLDKDGNVKIKAAGNVTIDAGSAKDVIVNGGGDQVARKGDSVDGGTVTGTVTAGTVNFIYTPSGGAPGAPSATLALVGGKITSGADHFKG